MANDNPLFSDVNIDGQIRKIIDTQHFTGSNNEGRARSGEKNPFPVAGYGMTESGVWIPRKVSDEGHELTQVTGSSVEDGLSVKQVDKLEVIARLNNVEVGAGQGVMGYSNTVAERLVFTELRYNLIWSDVINWRLRYIPRITDSSGIAGSEISIDEASSGGSGILIDRVDFTRYSFILHNDDEEDVTLKQIEILGVRA